MRHSTAAKGIFALTIVWFFVCAGAAGVAIYVAAHFLAKVW
jgi:hypothetical protein